MDLCYKIVWHTAGAVFYNTAFSYIALCWEWLMTQTSLIGCRCLTSIWWGKNGEQMRGRRGGVMISESMVKEVEEVNEGARGNSA